MEPLTTAGLKATWPALRAGFQAVRHELARSPADDGALVSLGSLDDVLGEAVAVLAREADGLGQAAIIRLKGALSRPALFDRPAARRWIATALAQDNLLDAVRAALRGEDDTGYVEQAMAHYHAFLEDEEEPEREPDAEQVTYAALDFLLRSLQRKLTPGDRLLVTMVAGLADKVERGKAPDTSDLVDERVRDLVARMRRARFFRSADTLDTARQLAGLVIEGRFRGATPAAKLYALAWCARIAAFAQPVEARQWLAEAEALGGGAGETPEALLCARAFVAAQDDWSKALGQLDADGSPAQATAAFQIMRHGLGTEEALGRATRAGLTFASLDCDGRCALLTALVETRRWDEALAATRAIESTDYEANPALLWIAASVLVASCLPVELRPLVLHDVPNTPGTCPLREDPAALEAQRTARALVEELAGRCDDLDLPREAAAARRYALWLMLVDPDAPAARSILRERFADAREALTYLPLALAFGLDVDREAAAAAIERRLALEGAPAPETVNALVALLIDRAMHAPGAAAALLDQHRAILSDCLEPRSLFTLETRILVDMGERAAARSRLEAAPYELGDAERALLEDLVEGGDSQPSIAALEAIYRESPQLGTLVLLVNRYRELGVTPRYLELARALLEQMPTSDFAEEIIGFLVEHGRDVEAHELLGLVGALIERSDYLRAHAAWLHFRLGDLAAAEAALARLEAARDVANDRELRLQLLVASGRWDELDTYLDRQWRARAERTPIELARCATLAARIGAKRAADFAAAAVAAAPSDPQVLVAAYMAATTAGIEEDLAEAPSWLMHAAALSGDDGPVRAGSIEDLLDGREDWEERSDAATKALVAGSATLDAIAALVARSWLELHLAPLVINPTEPDRRHRRLRAPFSGFKRIEPGETIAAGTIAIAADALVTLAVLDALDVLTVFDRVLVPHDLLADLFEQKSRLSFHQPSRIAFARRLLQLVATDAVRPFRPTSVPDLALVADIGLARAALLREAAAQAEGQHVVVHPFPIRKVGALLADPVALDAYAAHLVSCSGVLAALERTGHVTAVEAAQASAYLVQHEEPWPDEPVIAPGAVLYLSDLAVAYFRYTGLLERIPAAGMTVIVSDSELGEARGLTANAALSEAVDRILTRLRISIAVGLAEGRIALAPAARSDEPGEARIENLFGLIARAPVLVSDDRFLNRHRQFDHEAGATRILSSLDLLRMLANGGRFDAGRLGQALVDLRQRGAAFVPVTPEELVAELARTGLAPAAANAEAGTRALQETGELRALRENLRLIQAHGWYDPAHDTAWLADLQSALVEGIMAQFSGAVPDDLARARADWLVHLLDARDWSESLVGGGLAGIAEHGSVLEQARMLGAAFSLEGDAAARFARWFEDNVVTPAWAREPRLKPLLLNHLRGFVRSVARDVHQGEGADERQAASSIFARLPEFLQLEMLSDTAFQDVVGYTFETRVEIADATFVRGEFVDAARRLYAVPDRALTIADEQGRAWSLKTDSADPHWPLLFERDGAALRLRGLPGIHSDPSVRIAMLDALLREKSIAGSALADWRDRLARDAIAPDDIEALEKDFAALPPLVAEAIGGSFETGSAAISLLVPESRAYWEHLAGNGDAPTLAALIKQGPGPAAWFAGDPIERACWALLLASHPSVLSERDLGLDAEQWRVLGEWALAQGDVLALAGFIELALPRAADDPTLETLVLAVAAKIEALDPADEGGALHLFSSLAMFVEGELSRAGTVSDWPAWRRRMAAMAHAALLARGTQGEIDTARLSRFCLDQRGWRYVLQTLVDMRDEPRWRGDYMAASQLRHELLGRIFNAASAMPPERLTPGLEAALLAPQDSLRARIAVPMALLPGPLEGAINDDLQSPPTEILTALDAELEEETIGIGLVRQLINLEGLMRLPADICARAAQRIRAAGARLLSTLSPGEVHMHLLGLANLAASHRLPELADTVQELARLHRARAPMDVGEEMQLALHAAAAHADHAAWAEFLGNWVRDLTYRTDDRGESERLLGWLDGLCEVDPKLRTRTGQARAVVRLLLGT